MREPAVVRGRGSFFRRNAGAAARGTRRVDEMIDVIKANLDAVAALCRTHRVRTLHLFGSAATGSFDPERSDIDFLVEFLPDAPRTGFGGAYFALRDDLSGLLGRPIDLAEATALRNPYVISSIEQSKVPLYAAA
jgi:predicted nucleotidyltransferase